MIRLSFLTLALLILSLSLNGQASEMNEYIVVLEKGVDIETVSAKMSETCPVQHSRLDEDFDFYKLSGTCVQSFLEQDIDGIRSWQKNGFNFFRETYPNDSLFGRQRNLDIIQAAKAWDITTGGKSGTNQDIVVAVMDELFALEHPDLVNNIYVNSGEIQDDGIDNDNNGYVDDYYGYHAKKGNDDHDTGGNWHGTSVAGIIGAEGNNNTGIAGINWNVKLLFLSPVRTQDEIIIQNLMYLYKLRDRYNRTNGQEGALVVAANMSFGANNVKVDQFLPLCEMIDSVGQVGILTVAAGPNDPIDIDLNGDKPNDCKSSFLIAVTNSDQTDALTGDTGYGKENMDIAAPGDGSFSTRRFDEYAGFNGASASAPQVAATVALLYSLGCERIEEMITTNPAAAAQMIKDVILESRDGSTALEDKVSSGGRLNVFKALELLRLKSCAVNVIENKIDYISQSDDSDQVKFNYHMKDAK